MRNQQRFWWPQGENMRISLRNYQFSEGIKNDVRGSTVYGVNEEQLGKIDDLIFDERPDRSNTQS